MFCKSIPVFLAIMASSLLVSAQEKNPIRFGHVNPEDFSIATYNVDTTSGGVIIADAGASSFELNSTGSFSVVYKHSRRIKVINKNAFSLGDVRVRLYVKEANGEDLENVNATTYNMEDGKVVATKLKSDAIFTVKMDKYHIEKKFTLANIKEGSILEYSYTVRSKYIFLFHSWDFQSEYPTVWSEYQADIPEFFKYLFLIQGYEPFYKKTSETHTENFIFSQAAYSGSLQQGPTAVNSVPGTVFDYKWIMRNVPALKKEKFTTSISNHIAKIDFQLSTVQYPNSYPHNYLDAWEGITDDLLKADDFGDDLNKSNNWLNDDLKIITAGSSSDEEKARKVFYYVKKNIKCNDDKGIWLSKSLKQVFKDKNGSAAEINLLLVTMLHHEDLAADPVILSTRDNGYINNLYPMVVKFNYVVCKLNIQNKIFYLDASKNYLGFNRIPQNCYNGGARVVDKPATPVSFSADSLTENNTTTINLVFDSGKWIGNIKSVIGYYGASLIRETIITKSQKEYEKSLKSFYDDEGKATDIQYVDLDSCEKPLEVDCKINIPIDDNSNIIYFDPMIKNGQKENYFKSAQRKYPVEMPYKTDETYTLHMVIPAGYVIDELPKSENIFFKNEADGFFDFSVSSTATDITLVSHVKLNHAYFNPKDYEALRAFFDEVVKKHSEQFVFKKKTS
jgi:hypothetical protein